MDKFALHTGVLTAPNDEGEMSAIKGLFKYPVIIGLDLLFCKTTLRISYRITL